MEQGTQFKKEEQVEDKNIPVIITIIGGLFLFKQVSTEGLFTTIILGFFRSVEDFLFYFLSFIIIPLALLLFWKRKKLGWILVCFYTGYTIVNSLLIGIRDICSTVHWSGISIGNITTILVPVILYGVIEYLLFKPRMRKTYKISAQAMIITGLSTALISVALDSYFHRF
jgi:hypothetical protein